MNSNKDNFKALSSCGKVRNAKRIPFVVAILPVAVLLAALMFVICTQGADAISTFSPVALLCSSAFALCISVRYGLLSKRGALLGAFRSGRQILPAVPMLVCIAVVATTWMISGVVPFLIYYGLGWLNATFFLVTACVVCAVVSVLTGSSWSTIATIGIAFMGIGSVMGYSAPWIAGAIISGAYFGDKISPLSDTTVVASSACGVDLFAHMRYLMQSSVPALIVALIVYSIKGLTNDFTMVSGNGLMLQSAFASAFNLHSSVLIIPAITLTMIFLRVPTLITLALSGILGFIGIFIFQPHLHHSFASSLSIVWAGNSAEGFTSVTDPTFCSLVVTGGILGMLPTICLVLSAMIFGASMIGSGLLGVITDTFVRCLKKRTSIVGATVASGLMMNSTTADQYLSLIITGNMFRNVYRKFGLERRLLSRTIEDSVSVTSVLIPWNSCGITQSTVLGVATLAYMPFCIFNWLSPCMSLLLAWTGWRIPEHRATSQSAPVSDVA